MASRTEKTVDIEKETEPVQFIGVVLYLGEVGISWHTVLNATYRGSNETTGHTGYHLVIAII